MKDIPVYLFMGFLESGKTMFIQKTISNENFGKKENILLLVCEEGIEDYDFSEFKEINVSLHILEEESDLDTEILIKLAEEFDADIIVIEYNGMWHMANLIINKPENWKIFQTVYIADASSFEIYSQNLKSLVVDKVNVSDVVIFNRYINQADINNLHSEIRKINRRSAIYYESADGEMISDDIEDPLPFDIDADTIIIKDEDYAVWYSDIMNDAYKYNGKTVNFKAIIANRPEFPQNIFAVGRFIMTCCEADMQFSYFVALYSRYFPCDREKWMNITAEITVQHHESHDINIPVLKITDMYECDPPENPIASFI